MCSTVGCNQNPYFESKFGRCYYHWKVNSGLIVPDKEDTQTKMHVRDYLFSKYVKVVQMIANRTQGLSDDEREDLAQHLMLHLWVLTDRVRPDASEKEVYNFVRLSTGREASYYINYYLNYHTNNNVSIDLIDIEDVQLNPEEIFYSGDLHAHRQEVVWGFVIQELSALEGSLFRDLFLDYEIVTLRFLGDKHGKSHEWVRKYGQRLYNRFKEFIGQLGYDSSEFI